MNIKFMSFNSKKIVHCALLLLLLTYVGGCTSATDPLVISKNTINLQKIALAKTGIVSYEKQFFPVLYSQIKLIDKVIEAGGKIFDYPGYFQEVKFNGVDYYLYNSHSRKICVIRKSDMKKILYLSAPWYFYVYSSFPIMMNNETYLVVYAELCPKINSSMLVLLDSKLKIVYQEILLGAKAVGYTYSEKYGNGIVIESRDFWIKKPKVSINGNWLYYMEPEPGKQK
jgi:hypothetical protein